MTKNKFDILVCLLTVAVLAVVTYVTDDYRAAAELINQDGTAAAIWLLAEIFCMILWVVWIIGWCIRLFDMLAGYRATLPEKE